MTTPPILRKHPIPSNGPCRVLFRTLQCWVWLLGCIAWTQRAELPPELQSRVQLKNAHVDLRVLYSPTAETNQLSLVIRDEDLRLNHEATNAILMAPLSAQVFLPPGFDAFGTEGDPLWILPQSQNPELLYLGISAEGIGGGTFTGPITLRLVSVEGPGSFFLWQFDSFSGLNMAMNSRDGISEADTVQLFTGSHAHFNWGFGAKGLHSITFQASARRPGETNDVVSLPTAVLFAVEPLPDLPPPTAWEQWRANQWPGVTDPAVVGPGADPDLDGFPNLIEFFCVTEPKSAASRPHLKLTITQNPADGSIVGSQLSVLGRNDLAALLDVWVETSDSLNWSTATRLNFSAPKPTENPALAEWIAIDSTPVGNPAPRIYRIAARLK